MPPGEVRGLIPLTEMQEFIWMIPGGREGATTMDNSSGKVQQLCMISLMRCNNYCTVRFFWGGATTMNDSSGEV